MARFILDVANCTEKETQAIMTLLIDEVLSNKVATITCIDKTNENQFHEPAAKNGLSEKQIETYNKIINSK